MEDRSTDRLSLDFHPPPHCRHTPPPDSVVLQGRARLRYAYPEVCAAVCKQVLKTTWSIFLGSLRDHSAVVACLALF